jgi:large subunit ribosomal protein L22
MPGPKTNERPGTRAVLRNERVSAYKVRPVLDLIRGLEVERARDTLQLCERDAATLVGKLLQSAIANAENNDGLDPEELYVSACFADEGTTMKRWRPRARGRATRIRKRGCHVTVIVSRLPEERLTRLRARQAADAGGRRRRVAGGRQTRRTRRDEQRPGTATAPETAVETPSAPVDEPQPEPAAPEVETRPAVEETGGADATTGAPAVEDRPAVEGDDETPAAADEEKDV